MRLVLTIRGTDVIDLELLWPSKRTEPPVIQAAGELAASELAEPMEPDTAVFGFTPTREA